MGTDILPPEFISFIKFAAASGLFALGVFLIGICYKYYKKIVGEDKAQQYKKYFLLATLPLLLIVVYIYLIFFR